MLINLEESVKDLFQTHQHLQGVVVFIYFEIAG